MLLAALVCAGPAVAQDKNDDPPAPPAREVKLEPLSAEDAELVKELALLEKLELVKNLELFEEDYDQPRDAQRQP
jgi:hypothetical protein